MGEHRAELHEILNKHGRKPGFCTCECATCHGSRKVDRKITARQALHTVLGADAADNILRDMGWHWAVVAVLAVGPRGPAADCIKELSDSGFHLS